ncbi:MAG: HipA domain-containing protein [Acidobacteria bacterium]|nr:HipA domain-containing protein [Acidobacteriota bacterium]
MPRRDQRRYRTLPSVDHYKVVPDLTVLGAAAKDVLEDPDTGIRYIAKLGGRNSDIEVVTEYAIYLVGRGLGVSVAEGRIARYRGRLRFLSRYFLDTAKNEELVHGVQLFHELYDESTVHEVLGNTVREQEMFSVQSIKAAFGAHYGNDTEEKLFEGLTAMLTHDALIGVMDRHHENWGLIVQRGVADPDPRFAPLYDSARGLFCNETDEQLLARNAWQNGMPWLKRYIERSRPLIGFAEFQPTKSRRYLTHIELLSAVYWEYPRQRPRIMSVLKAYDRQRLAEHLMEKLDRLCSPRRRDLIMTCLRRRQKALFRALDTTDYRAGSA